MESFQATVLDFASFLGVGVVGLGIEFSFATVRKHPINEGFLVSGLLLFKALLQRLHDW